MLFAFGINAHHTYKTIDCAASWLHGAHQELRATLGALCCHPAVDMWLPCGQELKAKCWPADEHRPAEETQHHPKTHTSMDKIFIFSFARPPPTEPCEMGGPSTALCRRGCVIAVGGTTRPPVTRQEICMAVSGRSFFDRQSVGPRNFVAQPPSASRSLKTAAQETPYTQLRASGFVVRLYWFGR